MPHQIDAVRERLTLIGAVTLALLLVASGVALSRLLCDPHWMNRAGAAIVAVQVIAIAVEVSRRRRLDQLLREVHGSPTATKKPPTPNVTHVARERFMHEEILRSERQAFGVVVLLAVVGELMHGFGDLLLKLFE